MTLRSPARVEATSTLLWEACRHEPDASAVAGAVDGGADVELALGTALRERVGPLLWRALSAAGRQPDGPAGRHMQELVRILDLQERLLVPHVLDLAAVPLVAAGLEPVVLKGPTVAARYPAPGLRPMDDLDLLLPAEDHRRALEVLQEAGWQVVRHGGRDHYDIVFRHRDAPTMPLELHYGFEAPFERATGLDPRMLWSRRRPLTCMGVELFGLPPADEIVMLCSHAAKPFHGFTRLVWIADLVMLAAHAESTGEPIDWQEVTDLAGKNRCDTAVAVALTLARRSGAAVPPGTFPLPKRQWRRAALAEVLDPGWPLLHPDTPPFGLRFALADSWRLRTKLLLGGGHELPFAERMRWAASSLPRDAIRRWRQLRRGHRSQSTAPPLP